jgi:hypothetical protein
MHIASIGIDLGKTTFHLVAFGQRSKVLIRKKFSRAQLLAHTANLPALCRSRPRSSSMCRPCTEFGIDWCNGAQH